MASVFLPKPSWAALGHDRRELSLVSLHTGERLAATYWVDGGYDKSALSELDHILRDFRTDEVHPINPLVFDLLFDLKSRLGTRRPIEIISGYRSPKTNAMLAKRSNGVARHSLHMQGKAVDIKVAGVSTDEVRKIGVQMRRGGVGYYPRSGFVHMDVGRVRYW